MFLKQHSSKFPDLRKNSSFVSRLSRVVLVGLSAVVVLVIIFV